MFSLIRRISGSVIPRPDRPWDDDATSNAPKIGRKRRLSVTDDDDEDANSKKKARGNSVITPTREDSAPPAVPHLDTAEVTEVTQGVKEVALDEKEKEHSGKQEELVPHSVPLPKEISGELDEEPVTSTSSALAPASKKQEETSPLDHLADQPLAPSPGAIGAAVQAHGQSEALLSDDAPTTDRSSAPTDHETPAAPPEHELAQGVAEKKETDDQKTTTAKE